LQDCSLTQYDGRSAVLPGEVTEIHVVTLMDFGPAAAHAFSHKSGIGEITNGNKLFSTMVQQPLVSQCLLVFEYLRNISLKNTTLCRIHLDEGSARRTDLYLTTHNTQNRHTSMLPARFEPAIPASDRPQTHALDRAASSSTLLRTFEAI
jgi:hypothetical protein